MKSTSKKRVESGSEKKCKMSSASPYIKKYLPLLRVTHLIKSHYFIFLCLLSPLDSRAINRRHFKIISITFPSKIRRCFIWRKTNRKWALLFKRLSPKALYENVFRLTSNAKRKRNVRKKKRRQEAAMWIKNTY